MKMLTTSIIAKSTEIVDAKLYFDRKEVKLDHVVDLKMVVINTSRQVCELLALLFPDPIRIPKKDTLVSLNFVDASHTYLEASSKLCETDDENEMIALSRQLIEICILAEVVITITENEFIRSKSAFEIVEYLANNARGALILTAQWQAYLDHKEYNAKRFVNHVGLKDPPLKQNPLKLIPTFVLPWPELCGIDLGGRNVLQIASNWNTDIIGNESGTFLRFKSHAIFCGNGHSLVDDFERNAPIETTYDLETQLLFQKQIGSYVYHVRAQRSAQPGKDSEYSFRILLEHHLKSQVKKSSI